MIFPPLLAFFGKTRSADSGHSSLSRGRFGGAVMRRFGVDEEVDGLWWGTKADTEGAAVVRFESLEMAADRQIADILRPSTRFHGCWQIIV